MSVRIRRAFPADQRAVSHVESQATPRLRYVDAVFSDFSSDPQGEFSLVEWDGHVVGCGKLTRMPDETGWLELLRVLPDYQGRGVGKLLYAHLLARARQQGFHQVRMYTNEHNQVSKGLAERFGLRAVATYRGYFQPVEARSLPLLGQPWPVVADAELAQQLLLPLATAWGDFLVMNRTFYAVGPPLVAELVARAQAFQHPPSGSLLVMGCRFLPEQALHLALMAGHESLLLEQAQAAAAARGAPRLQCMFPADRLGLSARLTERGFRREEQDFLVMEVSIGVEAPRQYQR